MPEDFDLEAFVRQEMERFFDETQYMETALFHPNGIARHPSTVSYDNFWGCFVSWLDKEKTA